MFAFTALGSVALLLACTAGADRGGQEASNSPTASTKQDTEVPKTGPDPLNAPVATGGRSSVHEWGLVAMQQGGGGYTVSVAAGAPTSRAAPDYRNMAPAKPVIYLHLPDEANPTDVTVQVDLIEGEFLESFPPATAATESETTTQRARQRLLWQLTASPGRCGRSGADAYPTLESDACRNVRDGYCEAAELARYETGDSACLKIGDESYNNLFYRGEIHEQVGEAATADDIGLGLRVSTQADGEILFSNRSGSDGQGEIYRIQRTQDGKLLTSHATFPKNGEDVRLPSPSASDPTLTASLHDMLVNSGLTADEAGAFESAWSATLTSGELPGTPPGIAPPPPLLQPARDALWFVIPRAKMDAMAPLTVTPKPIEVTRVFVGYVRLAGT